MGVLQREEWWGCWRGRSGESAAEGGVLEVLEREKCWGCCRGGVAREGLVRVLERERLSCKEFGSLPDEERFASFMQPKPLPKQE